MGRMPLAAERMIKEICEIASSPDENGWRVSEAVAEKAESLIQKIAPIMSRFPRGFSQADHGGGIRIEWWNDLRDNYVVLVMGQSQEDDYLFHQESNKEGELERTIDNNRIALLLEGL